MPHAFSLGIGHYPERVHLPDMGPPRQIKDPLFQAAWVQTRCGTTSVSHGPIQRYLLCPGSGPCPAKTYIGADRAVGSFPASHVHAAERYRSPGQGTPTAWMGLVCSAPPLHAGLV